MSNRYTKNKKQIIREKLVLLEEARMEKIIKKELAEEEKAKGRRRATKGLLKSWSKRT